MKNKGLEETEVNLDEYLKKAADKLNIDIKLNTDFIDSFCLFYLRKDSKGKLHSHLSLGSPNLMWLVQDLAEAIKNIVESQEYNDLSDVEELREINLKLKADDKGNVKRNNESDKKLH